MLVCFYMLVNQILMIFPEPGNKHGPIDCRFRIGKRSRALPDITIGIREHGWLSISINIRGMKERMHMQRLIDSGSNMFDRAY